MMSSSMLFSGSSVSKVLQFLHHLGVPAISPHTFIKHQNVYLQPAIMSMWKKEQDAVATKIKANGGKFDAAGDGRADSPGHSAQYGSYTLLDTRLNKVVHLEFVTVTEVTSSNAMEKEGLVRAVAAVEETGLKIGEITTDRHVSIRKHLREKKPGIKHSLDVWHAAKGLGKKIDKLGKKKGCDKVNAWKKSITNHLYWVASSTPGAEADVMEAKWLSVINHIQNIHRHENKLYPSCGHRRLTGRERKKKWMIPNEASTEKLVEILTKKALMKDVRMLSSGQQTSSLESYHAVVNHFAPKLLHFSYQGMKNRLMLSALHFNENSGREQAITKRGVARYKINRPKYKKGEHTVKKIIAPRTYKYVDHLTDAVYSLASSHEKASPNTDNPPSMCAAYERPDKQEAIRNHKSRFNIT